MTDIVNPVLRGMYPDPSWIWDPQSQQVAIVNSTFEYVPGLPIHVTDDLAHYQFVGHAVDEGMAHALLLDYVLDSGGLYAPTLRYIHGRYVIACTVARLDEAAAIAGGVDAHTLAQFQAAQGNFVIVADDLAGPWRGPYWVEGAEGIDPDLFEDADGTVFWTQTHGAPNAAFEGQTEVWTARIDPHNWMLQDANKTPLWRGFGAESVWAEGPHLYRIGEWTYLMTAEGGTSFDHSEMIMRAHTPHGLRAAIADAQKVQPQREQPGDEQHCDVGSNDPGVLDLFHPDLANPFLTHRMLGNTEPVQCVGHADLLHHPQLGWWLACLGTRQTRTDGSGSLNFLGRETFIAPVNWEHAPGQWHLESDGIVNTDATPGWPVLACGTGRLVEQYRVNAQEVQVQHLPFDSDPTQQIVITDWDDNAQLLTVRGEQSLQYRRITEERWSMTLPTVGHVQIRQDDRHRIDLVTDAQGIHWYKRAGDQTLADETAGIGPWVITFVHGTVRISTEEYGNARTVALVDATALSTEYSGGFVGCMIGLEM